MTRRRTLTVAFLIAMLLVPMAATPAAANLSYGDERADLDIREEAWIDSDDSSNVDRTTNRTIYGVEGPRYEIALKNVPHENVTDYGVADGEASISYDAQRNVWVVEPAGEGTIGLYWDAVEDGERTRYAASLEASNVQWTHHKPGEMQELRNDAENWSQAESSALHINPHQPADETISDGLTYAQFFDSPFASFRNDIKATVIMLTLRPGGLAILGVLLAISVIGAAAGYRYRNKTRKQFEEWDEIQTERDQVWLDKARRIIQQYGLSDLFPDHIARAMTNLFGPNPWVAFKNYMLMRSPTHTKGLVLQMMAQIGYVGVVNRDDEGDIAEVRAVHESQLEGADDFEDLEPGGNAVPLRDLVNSGPFDPDDDDVAADGGLETVPFETLRYDNREDREKLSKVPGGDLDLRVFDDSVTVNADDIQLPIDNHNIEDAELIAEINPKFPGDFEDEQQYARVLGELLEFVVNHPLYTDDEGRVREEMDLLAFLGEMDSVLADKADFPVADTQRKALFWIAEELDPNSKLRDEIDDRKSSGTNNEEVSDAVISESDIESLDDAVTVEFDDLEDGDEEQDSNGGDDE